MFLSNYLDEFYFSELLDNYDNNYLMNIDQNKFVEVYNVFKKYNFNYIEDIILGYLDIFDIDKDIVERKIIALKKYLGSDFVEKIGDDLFYLEYILR